jgi:hypothetical protein
VLGLQRLRRALRAGGLHQLVVKAVASVLHRAVDAGRADDDNRLQRLEVVEVLVDLGLDRCRLALAPGSVHGDERLGVRELHPLPHRFGRESTEDDVVGGADPRAGEHRHDDLRDHRQVDADDVPLLDAAVAERVGEALDIGEKVGVGDVALLALLPTPVEGDPVAVARLDVAVETVRRRIEPAVAEPPVEGSLRVVQPFGRLLDPVEEVQRLTLPPALRVGGRLLVYRGI